MSNALVIIKMCYVHKQWYGISCATLCFRNIVLKIKCLFRFSLQRLSETLFILVRTERDMIKNVYLHLKDRFSCTSLTELEFSGQMFEKYLNIKLQDHVSCFRGIPF